MKVNILCPAPNHFSDMIVEAVIKNIPRLFVARLSCATPYQLKNRQSRKVFCQGVTFSIISQKKIMLAESIVEIAEKAIPRANSR
jgi:hypothetical protein